MNGWTDRLVGRLLRAVDRVSGKSIQKTDSPAPAPSLTPVAPGQPLSDTMRAERRELLARAEGFGGWWVGYAGAPLPELTAFRELLDDPEARETARHLLERGSAAGVAYGLSLLWLVDHAAFEGECARFRARTDPVLLRWGGCMMGGNEVPLASLIASPTAMKLDGPGDTIEAWTARHPGQSGGVDIEGGGYPRQLAGR